MQHEVNPDRHDARAENHVTLPTTGHDVDIRLNWEHVKTALSKGAEHVNTTMPSESRPHARASRPRRASHENKKKKARARGSAALGANLT